MAVLPEIARLLPGLESTDVVSYADSPIAHARAAHDASVAQLTPARARAEVATVFDRTIPGPVGPIPIRVYQPGGSQPLPVVLWLHGGGWCTGSLQTGDVVAREIAAGLPAVVVAVDYRLAPESPWPAAADDAAAALDWVTGHAAALGADPACVVVGGDSAGGNLAAALVLSATAAGQPLAGQLLVYPALDLDSSHEERYPSVQEYGQGYALPLDNLWQAVRKYVPEETSVSDPRISPLSAADLTGLPPTVLAIAECDPLADQGRQYAARLSASSVPVRFHEGRGLIHGAFDFVGAAPSVRREIRSVLSSLRDALGSQTERLVTARVAESRTTSDQ